jgi:hypothetical protein
LRAPHTRIAPALPRARRGEEFVTTEGGPLRTSTGTV